MIMVSDLKILVKKREILNAVSAYYNISHIEDMDECFERLRRVAIECIEPLGIYSIEDMSHSIYDHVRHSVLKDCRHIIYCVFSIGNLITEKIDDLFDKNQFDDAILLDAISTSILFHMSNQMYDRIYEFAKGKGMGLSCRVAPGDGEIDIVFQKTIVEKFTNSLSGKFNLQMENDYIVKPYKTITYVYGADKSIGINKEDHMCSRCQHTNCFMRNSETKTRGSFVEPSMILAPGKC